MANYFQLFSKYKRILIASFLLSFFSGFGQSFFISNFTPHFLKYLSLSQASFGLIYACATLSSAILLPWIGSKLDYIDDIRYIITITICLSIACLIMASINSILIFTLGLFGLRLCGQGLFSHTSGIIIARGFSIHKGRALSIVGLGHPASEAVLPLFAFFLISTMGWRISWLVFACILIFLFLPLIPYLLKGTAENNNNPKKINKNNNHEAFRFESRISRFPKLHNLPEFIKSWKFWFIAMGSIFPGFILTGIFLYHGILAEEREWSMAWMASGFMWFALSQVIFSLMGGPLTDKLSAKTMFTFYLLPLAMGLSLLSLEISKLWLVPTYLSFAGASSGLGSPLRTAIWVEIYGTQQIASIKSWVTSISVASTAISAPILGLILDMGYGFSFFLRSAAIIIFIYSVIYKILYHNKVFT